MDPNKIHIDELVRQRLLGGEEEPRPGAWMSMRDLLDKQMPVGSRPLGGMAWGRAARWTTALVLLTLVAGGYGAMDIRRASRENLATNSNGSPKNIVVNSSPAATEIIRANSSQSANTIASSKTEVKASTTAPEENIAASSTRTQASAAGSFSSASFASAAPRGSRSGGRSLEAISTIKSSTTSGDVPSTGEAQPKSTRSVENAIAAPIAKRRYAKPTANLAKLTNATENASAGTNNEAPKAENANTMLASKREARRNTVGARVGKEPSSSQRVSQSTEPSGAGNLTEIASAARKESPRSLRTRNTRTAGTKTRNISDTIKAQVQRDTVRPIRIAQRYISTRGVHGGRYVTDTLATMAYVIERPLPAIATTSSSANKTVASTRARRRIFGKKNSSTTNDEVAAAATPSNSAKNAAGATAPAKSTTAQLNPAASAPIASAASKSSSSESLVPLSSMKVSSTKSDKMQYSAQEQIQDAMRRTQFLFGQMRLYTGVTGGFNASVGGTSMGGFQVGLVGLLAINERWSAGLEGKFVQRFNRGAELHDPYFHYRASTFNRFEKNGEAYNVYRVTSDSFDHYYKLSTIESVEFPLYARYSFRRFHAFGGANVTYGLRVKNIERVERFAGRESNGMDTVLASTQYAPPANTAATVKLDDFGPRFGLGYTAGVGYQASPAVLVDVRMTQLLWDNRSAGAGGLRVSQTFYRVPSLQLSIGYRFSQQAGRR